MIKASYSRVAEVFVEVADTLIDDFDLIEFLAMVTDRASELVGSSAAGLLLADAQGRLQFMAASDERAHLVELFQVRAEQGPCQDCYSTGHRISVPDLAQAADRWPMFAPRAMNAGFQSVHAFPLRLRNRVIGALNLFGSDTGEIARDDADVVQALADLATIGLLNERAIRRADVLTEQLQGALNSRIIIEQAKGALAQGRGVGVDEAFNLIRSYARAHHLYLGDVATAVITNPAEVQDLISP